MFIHTKSVLIWVLLVLLVDRAFLAWGASTTPEIYFRSDGGIAIARNALPGNLDAPEALRWRAELGAGHSTPAVFGNRIFLTTYSASEKELAVIGLNRATGQRLWKQVVPVNRLEQVHPATGSPAAASPACDGERVYAFFGSYGLICYDLDGAKLWEVRLGPFQDEYGASSSPVLVDDLVVLSEDHDLGSFLTAFDRRTGHLIWKTSRPDAVRSYSTPAVWSRDGHNELLVAGALELAGYDAGSGEKRWWVHGLARIVIPVPIVSERTVYMASWTPGGDSGRRISLDPWTNALTKWDRNHDGKLAKGEIDNPDVLDRFVRMDLDQSGDLDQAEWERHADVFRRAQNAILALKPSGSGDLTSQALQWTYQKGIPYVATPLVHRGIVWMVKDGGIVTKLEAANGRLISEERLPAVGNYFASPEAGDGKVYFAGELGTISVVADQVDWQILSSHNLREKIYATPVIDGPDLFIRTEVALYSYSDADQRK